MKKKPSCGSLAGPILLGISAALVCMTSLTSCEKKRPELTPEEYQKNIDAEIEAETRDSEAPASEDSE